MSKKYPGGIVTAAAPAGYSVAFDGATDYLTIANNAALDLTGDFTIECWVYITNISPAYNPTIVARWGASGGQIYTFQILNGGTFRFITSAGTWTGGSVSASTWTHLAVSRSGSSLRMFNNGALASTNPDSTSLSGTQVTSIGGENNGAQSVPGYVSNVRIVKGTALYTAAFTPPTQLFNITNTSLLTCNSPAIVDQGTANAGSGFPITANGDAKVSTFTPFQSSFALYNNQSNVMLPSNSAGFNPAYGAAAPGVWTLDQANYNTANRLWPIYDPYYRYTTLMLNGNSPTNVPTWITDVSTNNFAVTPVSDAKAANLSPFSLTTYPNSGSGYFDGAGDYISVADNAALQFGSGDFTLEFFVYFTAGFSGAKWIAGKGDASTAAGTAFSLYSTTFDFYSGGTAYSLTPPAWSSSQWYHVAIVRSGTAANNLKLYINGAVQSQASVSTNTINTGGSNPLKVGEYSSGSPISYISNFRVVKGVAVYTGAFTTPTAPLGATQSAGTNISAITGTSTSLLTLQNSQSSNNNSFLDSSSNNFLITRPSGANTPQGTFTPFSQTGWSGSISLSGASYISGTLSASHGTGDFTYELWAYITAFDAPSGESGYLQSSTTAGGLSTSYTTGICITRYGGYWNANVLGTNVQSNYTIQLNTWQHVAVVRSSGVVSLYVNGISVATPASITASITATNIAVGGYYSTGYIGTGYLSNVRVLNSAAYTSNFTPPTSPLPSTNATFLTLQSNRFVNNASGGSAITVNGTSSVQAFSPFAPAAAYDPTVVGGSVYFDGSSDYLTAPASSSYSFAGNFTIECWFYPTAALSTATSLWIMAIGASNNFSLNVGSTSTIVYLGSAGGSFTATGNTIQNSWNHLAVVRNGSTVTLYINGSAASGTGNTSATLGSSSTTFYLGGYNGGISGYVTDWRINNGQALYTTNFTPTTAPLTTTSQNSTASNVKLLLNFTNGGIIDATGKNVLETVGNAQISTTQSKFGGSSMYFDGTDDRLSIPSSPNLDFGSGDFTIECWAYNTAWDVDQNQLFERGRFTVGKSYRGWMKATQIVLEVNLSGTATGTYTGLTATVTNNLNQWYHVAFVRSGSNFYIFRDGVQVATTTSSASIFTTTEALAVGGAADGNNNIMMNGYIDDFRITKGVARYTTTFTPPTSALQQQ